MRMIGKIVTAVAGRTVARSIGGATAGPAGMIVGAALPIVLPRLAATLGPFGMVAAALGTLFFGRYLKRRAERRVVTAGLPPSDPAAVLSITPQPARPGAAPLHHGRPRS